jgi:hypothetical protein
LEGSMVTVADSEGRAEIARHPAAAIPTHAIRFMVVPFS